MLRNMKRLHRLVFSILVAIGCQSANAGYFTVEVTGGSGTVHNSSSGQTRNANWYPWTGYAGCLYFCWEYTGDVPHLSNPVSLPGSASGGGRLLPILLGIPIIQAMTCLPRS